MKILLTEVTRQHLLDLEFNTDEGMIKNSDLPEENQVKATVTTASIADKDSYAYEEAKKGVSKMRFRIESCVKKHCTALTGLSDYGITDGKSLVAHPPAKELNSIIMEIFKIAMCIESAEDEEKDEA